MNLSMGVGFLLTNGLFCTMWSLSLLLSDQRLLSLNFKCHHYTNLIYYNCGWDEACSNESLLYHSVIFKTLGISHLPKWRADMWPYNHSSYGGAIPTTFLTCLKLTACPDKCSPVPYSLQFLVLSTNQTPDHPVENKIK